MYNLDQFTHKQIKVGPIHSQTNKSRGGLLFVCEWIGPGYTSINSGKNALNPYNSVTKFFFICFENLPLGIPSPSTHTYIPLMYVGHE